VRSWPVHLFPPSDSRSVDHCRDVKRLPLNLVSVEQGMFLSGSDSMIGGDHDHCVFQTAQSLELGKQITQPGMLLLHHQMAASRPDALNVGRLFQGWPGTMAELRQKHRRKTLVCFDPVAQPNAQHCESFSVNPQWSLNQQQSRLERSDPPHWRPWLAARG